MNQPPSKTVVGCIHEGTLLAFKSSVPFPSSEIEYGNRTPDCHRRVISLVTDPDPLRDFVIKWNNGNDRPTTTSPWIPGTWQYAVTTVSTRADNLLLTTLESLAASGFNNPTISVDGYLQTTNFANLTVIERDNIKAYPHWVLTLHELFLRNPWAQYYAIFQDDFVCVPNLRAYLTSCEYPAKGYLNLFTFMENDALVARAGTQGWVPAARADEGYQLGRSAVALVFNHEAVITLLTSPHMLTRMYDAVTGLKSIDGAVVTAMHKAGYTEYVHNPSLVQHIGEVSSMGNKKHPQSKCFQPDFDPLTLI